MIKRSFDFMLSLLGVFFSLPLWVLISLAILVEDGWPVFYAQERIGKDGVIFKVFKFRSMVKQAEKDTGPIQASENDCRVTKVGRILRDTALDELPQLFNILRGDISFVGPRALRLDEKEVQDSAAKKIFDYPHFLERVTVRPGLTGIAQIFVSRNISREKKFGYDIWYIRNQGFWLDIYIIILSFIITFEKKWETGADKFTFLGRGLKQKLESEVKG